MTIFPESLQHESLLVRGLAVTTAGLGALALIRPVAQQVGNFFSDTEKTPITATCPQAMNDPTGVEGEVTLNSGAPLLPVIVERTGSTLVFSCVNEEDGFPLVEPALAQDSPTGTNGINSKTFVIEHPKNTYINLAPGLESDTATATVTIEMQPLDLKIEPQP